MFIELISLIDLWCKPMQEDDLEKYFECRQVLISCASSDLRKNGTMTLDSFSCFEKSNQNLKAYEHERIKI